MAKRKPLEIKDSFELKIPKKECKELRDSVEDGKALFTKIKATHGGYVNGNKFFYSIDGMENATKTWVTPFQKPVLVHHDEKSDPIGRVIDAEFVPIGTNRRNKPKGYILLTCRITDQTAIEKILDNRYMTVSVSSLPTRAVCSICDSDLTKDGPCDHIRGMEYEDKLCYWTIDVRSYTEVSFVNKPADEYQKGVESSTFADWKEEDDFNFSVDINKAEFYLEDGIEKNEETIDLEEVDGTWTQDDLDMILWLIDQLEKDPDLKDAKLSTASRKKLSSKVFCGPNRSFPVNDCAHYTAALRLLSRYKGPGDKSRIKACIMRRGKTLNCSGASKTAKTKDEVTNMENELITKYKDEIESFKSEIETYKVTMADHEKAMETAKAEKQDLENQLSDKSKEIETLNEELIKYRAEKHEALANKVYDLRVNLGKKDVQDLTDEQVKLYKENLTKRTDESLTDSVADLKSEIENKNDSKPGEPTETITKDSVDTKTKEKQTEIKDGEEETKIEDLGDILSKKQ